MVSYDEFKKLDIRIAKIIEARKHPNADKLYLLRIETGDGEKEIVAGIRSFYTEAELAGKLIVVVNNLEPAVIRGIESSGMLLAARDEKTLSLIAPDKDIKPGTRLS